jgi:hypothetical protein
LKEYFDRSLELFIKANIDKLGVEESSIIQKISPPKTESVDYGALISTRNGIFKQFIKLRLVNGIWQEALKVERWGHRYGGVVSTVYEYLSPGYPLDKAAIQWDSNINRLSR